jgi:hypothetical protein
MGSRLIEQDMVRAGNPKAPSAGGVTMGVAS